MGENGRAAGMYVDGAAVRWFVGVAMVSVTDFRIVVFGDLTAAATVALIDAPAAGVVLVAAVVLDKGRAGITAGDDVCVFVVAVGSGETAKSS